MISESRKACRLKLHELVENKLTVENTLASEVHANPVGRFESTPAVVISSLGSDLSELTFRGQARAYEFMVETFLTLPSADDTTYDRAAAANAVDDIDQATNEVIEDNQKVAGYWDSLAQIGPTEVFKAELDGTQYTIEQKRVRVE